MNINPIRNETDYKATLKEVSVLMTLDPSPDSPEGERLDVLVTLVLAYEARHYPIHPPAPIQAIRFRMDQAGLTVGDMVEYIGPTHRVYEVLARKRPLTLRMIRRLVHGLGIPADVLIGPSVEDALAA